MNISELKVLLVLESPGYGGTEIYVETMATYLSNFTHVEIVLLKGSLIEASRRFPNFNVISVDGVNGLFSFLRSKTEPYIVNMHLYTSLFPAVLAARFAGATVLTTFHMPLKPWNGLHKIAWRLAALLSKGCIGVSEECLKGYRHIMLKKSKAIISGPLDFSEIPKCQLPKTNINKLFTVIYVGRLSAEKDLATLINAVSHVADMKLIIVGDGECRSGLEAHATAMNVNAYFTGYLTRPEIFEWLLKSDVFVLPSKFEGLGIAAIEAMAVGVPTITAGFEASNEYIIPDVTGLKFQTGDFLSLASHLELLRNDINLRDNLAVRGCAFVREKFTVETQCSKFINLVQSL